MAKPRIIDVRVALGEKKTLRDVLDSAEAAVNRARQFLAKMGGADILDISTAYRGVLRGKNGVVYISHRVWIGPYDTLDASRLADRIFFWGE